MNGLEAANRMLQERGYVVAGFPIGKTVSIGAELPAWANAPVPLIVTAETDRADWDEQFRLLFPRRKKNPADNAPKTARFFRCHPNHKGAL